MVVEFEGGVISNTQTKMASFLNQVATFLLERHGEGLPGVHIIVPTRRSVFFLKRELGKVIEKPLISPQIMSIEDFVTEASGLSVTDPVNLIFTLFEAFQEVDATVDFNRFMGWGTVLLSDFDRLDMALVRPDYLFEYLTEAKALERWNMDGSPPDGSSAERAGTATGTRQFFSLFANIRKVYGVFRSKLQAMGFAYPGMTYRYLAEHPELLDAPAGETFYFAGFNAFTASEMKIVQRCLAGGGAVLWDSDAYYMTANTYLEAGRYMRRMRERSIFGPEWNWMGRDLLDSEKTIHVYGVPNATLQTRVAGRIYREIRERNSNPGLTAIVLADETLLTPMLYALDDSVSDVNVTMGLPLRNSMIYTLADAIFELQQHISPQKSKTLKYNYRFVVKVLSHPFLRQYGKILKEEQGRDFVEALVSEIKNNNLVYLSQAHLFNASGGDPSGGDPLMKCLFTPWAEEDSDVIIGSFYELIDLLRKVYRHYESPAEQEYLYLFYTLLGKFEHTLKGREKDLNIQTVRQLLFELINQNKIPFSGEPVSDLQIIGLLETRALDFERVIILSVNEGILPSPKRQNSLIPFDIAREAGLPTHEHQEALSAYYFYRLLQRAEEVHLLYVNTGDAMGGGEKSRFLLQLENEWPGYNSKIKIVNQSVEWAAGTLQPGGNLELAKDRLVKSQITSYLTDRGLYPTHIHTLLNSPFDFYLKHVLRLEEDRETEETLGMDKLGSWLHNAFEILDLTFFLQHRDPSTGEIESVLSEQFRKLGGYETETGLNSLYYKVGAQQFMEFMKEQHLKAGHRWPVATEQNLSACFDVDFEGEVLQVRLGGKIDRVEIADDGTLYVMDYKTGSVDVRSEASLRKDTEKFLTEDPDYKMNYVRQLWLYQYLVYREMSKPGGWRLGDRVFRLEEHRVRSGFYSLRSPGKVTENPLVLTETGDPYEYMKETERILGIIIARLLDPSLPLERREFVI